MNFPMLNVTNEGWGDETDISIFVLFDAFIYKDDEEMFNYYYKDKFYCDSLGDIYQVVGKTPPTQAWRKLLRFVPNVYKVELQLKKTGRKMELETLRQFLLDRINELELTDLDRKWIKHVEQAPNHYEIIAGEVK